MKKTLKSTSIRMVAWLLAIATVLLTGIVFEIFPMSVNAATEDLTKSYQSENLYINHFYDNDNCCYTANSSTLHNEWSKFFEISLACKNGYVREGSTYMACGGYPMQIKISGTANYTAIHENGANNGTDGMHFYSNDTNGKVDGYTVGSGLIIIEYIDAYDTIVETQVVDGLWERDLSVPIDLLLKYHTSNGGYRVNVKLCFEVFKFVDEKKHYWNITEELMVTVRIGAKDIPYDRSFTPSANYWWIESDKENIKAALEAPIKVKGVNSYTTDNQGIRLELYSDYLKIDTAAGGVFYDKYDTSFNLLVASGKHHWWYTLEKDSYIEIDGEKSPLVANSNGVLVLEPRIPKDTYIRIKVHLNITFRYTYYEHAFGITTESANETKKCSVTYNMNIPVSMSNTSEILLYDNVAEDSDYSKTSLIVNGMIKETNTLAIVTSLQNKYTHKIQRYENGKWVSADVQETVKSKGERLYTLNSESPCEQYRVVLTDNQGKSRIETFYVIKDAEKLVELKTTNLQYNEFDTLPRVKGYDDHIITCSVPQLYEEVITSTMLEDGGERVTKKVIIGNKSGDNYLGTHYEFTYEFYVGEVDAPRLNAVKFQTNYYHLIPGIFSVEHNCKLYAFKFREDALLFAESLIKDKYQKPTTLAGGIEDKEKFDFHASCMVCEIATRQDLIDHAGGNIEIIYASSFYEAPIDKDNIYLYDTDFLTLSITDTVSVNFKALDKELIFELQQEESRQIRMEEISRELGYGEVEITENFYDGTSLAYKVIILEE